MANKDWDHYFVNVLVMSRRKGQTPIKNHYFNIFFYLAIPCIKWRSGAFRYTKVARKPTKTEEVTLQRCMHSGNAIRKMERFLSTSYA